MAGNEVSERGRIVAFLRASADIAIDTETALVYRALANSIEAGAHWCELPTEHYVYTGFEAGEIDQPPAPGEGATPSDHAAFLELLRNSADELRRSGLPSFAETMDDAADLLGSAPKAATTRDGLIDER